MPSRTYKVAPPGFKLSKTGKLICKKCGCYISDHTHPDDDGCFPTTVWCICECWLRYDKKGNPITVKGIAEDLDKIVEEMKELMLLPQAGKPRVRPA